MSKPINNRVTMRYDPVTDRWWVTGDISRNPAYASVYADPNRLAEIDEVVQNLKTFPDAERIINTLRTE